MATHLDSVGTSDHETGPTGVAFTAEESLRQVKAELGDGSSSGPPS